MDKRDVFICHASEDKRDVVRPITSALEEAEVSCWLDEVEIIWGDSLTQKVNEGIKNSRYAIIVLSPAFLNKHWPQRELNSLLNLEASSGEVKVLPLVVGDKVNMCEAYPLLNDKLYLQWTGDPKPIVEAMLSRLSKRQPVQRDEEQVVRTFGTMPNFPMPKVVKQVTQLDKDRFLNEAFEYIKQYFQQALKALENSHTVFETEYKELSSLKFISRVYKFGSQANGCKIWIGGLSSMNGICYQSGHIDLNNDNSFNEMLNIECDDDQIGLKPIMTFGRGNIEGILSKEQAAEYYWKSFIEYI